MDSSLAHDAITYDPQPGRGGNFLPGIARMLLIGALNETGYGADANQSLYADRLAERILDDRQDLSPDEAADIAIVKARACIPTAHDAAQAIAAGRNGPAYCYLAFFGTANRCQYVKVGLSSHPERRMQSILTGNPLDLLALYACRQPTRALALAVEKSMLYATQSINCRGEWLRIDECDRANIPAAVDALAGGGAGPDGARLRFEPVWIGDQA
jgi:hypothetical protein